MTTQSTDQFEADIAIIGGSGFYSLDEQATPHCRSILTPYDKTPVTLYGETVLTGNREASSQTIWFMPRHGKDHSVPPHLINYRANIWALKSVGVKKIIAVNAVGGITPQMAPGQVVVPTQIIDYSWGREHTFFDGLNSLDNHIDFTWPYDKSLNQLLSNAAKNLNIPHINSAVYACTQGPRLETAAEISKLERDGADIVGMTAMPEAALAREVSIAYSSIALVVNWGAGLTDKEISMDDIIAVLNQGVTDARKIIHFALLETFRHR